MSLFCPTRCPLPSPRVAFAEFERGMIQERALAGMARAQAQGTKSGMAIGRPAVSGVIEVRIRDASRTRAGDSQDCDAGRAWSFDRAKGVGGPLRDPS